MQKKKISRNKNNNPNSNNNDLKDKQNHRFEKKETLYAFFKYKHYTQISLKQSRGEKK